MFKAGSAGVEWVGVGRWGVAVRGGDCAGISPEAEGRATQWSRGMGRRLRVDVDCVVLLADWPRPGGHHTATCPVSVRSESVYVCRAAVRCISVLDAKEPTW